MKFPNSNGGPRWVAWPAAFRRRVRRSLLGILTGDLELPVTSVRLRRDGPTLYAFIRFADGSHAEGDASSFQYPAEPSPATQRVLAHLCAGSMVARMLYYAGPAYQRRKAVFEKLILGIGKPRAHGAGADGHA
jgi:hypothetical protein